MKATCFSNGSTVGLAASIISLIGTVTAFSQGTITFDGAASFSGTTYSESGMSFQVVLPRGGSSDYMGGVPGGGIYGNLPYNETPYMVFFRQNNQYSYVSLSLTGGSLFGLTLVQLGDPNSPSLSPVSISFVGYLAGGSTVTNTFNTPGSGATTLANYSFGSGFASGLTSVDILAPKWAMDNLVFVVPEPTTTALAILGVCVGLGLRRRRS